MIRGDRKERCNRVLRGMSGCAVSNECECLRKVSNGSKSQDDASDPTDPLSFKGLCLESSRNELPLRDGEGCRVRDDKVMLIKSKSDI